MRTLPPKQKDQMNAKSYIFDFKHLTRTLELFNLGTDEHKSIPPQSEWFIQLFDVLKDGNNLSIMDFNQKYNCHPTDWGNTNLKRSFFEAIFGQDCEVYQFRITKGTRVIGVRVNNTFHIVLLDVMHNHCDCDGYPSARPYIAARSSMQVAEEQINSLNMQLEEKDRDIKTLKRELEDLWELYAESQESTHS